MALEVGLRVVRGPDWKWGAQDDGEGHVGTVVEIGKAGNPHSPEKTVVVQWDSGSRTNYRAGYQKAYDLRVLDNAPTGVKHPNIVCNACHRQGIAGVRWKCARCYDFDLCSACYHSDEHDLSHSFVRFETANSEGIPVSCRQGKPKLQARGIFLGAQVVRGHDWDWGNQDGGDGKVGEILNVMDWEQESGRSVANVTWSSGSMNIYRVGHKGKMDLRYVQDAPGGYYYRDHLPVLGITPAQTEIAGPSQAASREPSRFSVGDHVKILQDIDILKVLQDGHGGWNPRMSDTIGKVGKVHRVTERGDIRVQFDGQNNRWTFNPDALIKCIVFNVGDMVRVIDDLKHFKELQDGHGEYVENMKPALGKLGKVIKIYTDGDLRVIVDGTTWTLNPMCLIPVPGSQTELNNTMNANTREEHANPLLSHFLTTSTASNTAVSGSTIPAVGGTVASVAFQHERLVRDAALGKVEAVLEYLSKHPDRVNLKSSSKTALQVACHQGHHAIVDILLRSKANLEAHDEDGDTALHYAAFGNQPKVIETLLASGANINAQNRTKCTPLHVAVNKQYLDCVKILLRPQSHSVHALDINIQDSYGDTALHDSISKESVGITDLLISVPSVDFSLRNERGFNVLHHAALKGNAFAVEKLLARTRQLVDIKKEDGFAALHLAALNGHFAVVDLLLEVGRCDPDIRNNRQQTPLLLAVSQGHEAIVERLLKSGAGVNVQDEDGDTPLHVALIKRSALRGTELVETSDAPGMAQILATLATSPLDAAEDKGLLIACYLAKEGSDLLKENHAKRTPLSLAGSTEVEELLRFWAANSDIQPASPSSALCDSLDALHLDQKECEICLEAPAVVKFMPCGHCVTCEECCVRMKKCITCQQIVAYKTNKGTGATIPSRQRQGSLERLRQLESRLQEMEENASCSICMERKRDVAFLCGHAACNKCATPLKICHMCRKPVTKRIKLFL